MQKTPFTNPIVTAKISEEQEKYLKINKNMSSDSE